MKSFQPLNNKVRLASRNKLVLFVFILVAYFVVTMYYMGPAITSCQDSLYGFGDNTAGPIWRYSSSGGSMLGGYTNQSNFPDGESLYSPVNWVSMAQSVLHWGYSAIVGPVCGYNLLNVTGFLFTSVIVFYFVRWLLRNKYLAFLAGYLIAFSPYMQVKIGGHPNTAFSGIFVAIIWLSIKFIMQPNYKKALALGALIAFNFYLDPYFILYSSLTVLAVVIGYIIYVIIEKRNKVIELLKSTLKPILVMLATIAIFVAPFLVNYYISASSIQSQVASVRGNVLAEAKACSNYPHEYLVPFVLHPAGKIFGYDKELASIENKLKDNFSCGIGEDTVGISLAVIGVVLIGVLIFIWERINKRRFIRPTKEIRLAIYIVVSLLLVGLAFGLPPVRLFEIPTPNMVLLSITTTWRTMTRVYMLVNISVVILAMIILRSFLINKNMPKLLSRVLFATIVLFSFVEYQTFVPIQSAPYPIFSYSKDTPDLYKEVKNNNQINAIAEYPMESYGESDTPSYYLSMQNYHNKKLINSPNPLSSMESLRKSIKNLSDPQTLPALEAIGVQAIIVHGVDDKTRAVLAPYEKSNEFKRPRVTILSHTSVVPDDNAQIVYLKSRKTDTTVGILQSGFYRNLGIIHGLADWQYEAVDGAEIKLRNIKQGSISDLNGETSYCFDIRTSLKEDKANLILDIDGVTKDFGTINNDYKQIKVQASKNVIINNSSKVNMQLTRLGCPNAY